MNFVRPNDDVRRDAKTKNVKLWEIADWLGISEPTLVRHMRHELPAVERERVYRAIDAISTRRAELEAM